MSEAKTMPAPKIVNQMHENWKSITVIITIVASAIGGWNYTMAYASDEAEKTAKLVVREEVKDVAREEVKKALDESRRQHEAQKDEAAELAAERMFAKLKREGKLK